MLNTFALLQLISVVLAVFGLFLIAFSDGFKSSSLGGVAMILCSAFFAALFTVRVQHFKTFAY